MTQSGAYEGFEGRVGRTVAGSEPWWPARARASSGAPNVVIVLADDLGYSDLGCYGSEIATPNLDALAARGLRYGNFHVAPTCSPTRAALLTGLNSHAAGFGAVANFDPGFPGYSMELADDVLTMAEVFRANGYATFAAGKWHLCKDSDTSPAGPVHSWPIQRGFDHFYGVLTAGSDYFFPHQLTRDNTDVSVDDLPDGYYTTDDFTDQAIAMVETSRATAPDRPFLLYLALTAPHAPLHAKSEDMEKYRGRYEGGWDALRDERFARQQELGILSNGSVLAARNDEPANEVAAWGTLRPELRSLFARYMETYAAMVDNVDQNVGRLIGTLERSGQLANTIFMFASDNGASREGSEFGTTTYWGSVAQYSKGARAAEMTAEALEHDLERIDLIGRPRALAHYPRGWAMACNTPLRLYKTNTHAGGHQVPFIVSWPDQIRDVGAIRHQYTYVTQLLPTLIELCGLRRPTHREGRAVKDMSAVSFAPTLGDAAVPSSHPEQYYESSGHRGYYADGWEIVTLHQRLTPFNDNEWQLYHLAEDPSESVDLAERHPERVRDLAARWETAAWANQAYPLNEGSGLFFALRPPRNRELVRTRVLHPGVPPLNTYLSGELVRARSFSIHVAFHFRSGDEGMLVAHGDQDSGYCLYVEDDTLIYAQNTCGRVNRLDGGVVPPGSTSITVDISAPGGFVWDVSVAVDGVRVAAAPGWSLLPFVGMQHGIRIGRHSGPPIDWDLRERRGRFEYSGALQSVTYTPGELAPDAIDHMLAAMREMGSRFE